MRPYFVGEGLTSDVSREHISIALQVERTTAGTVAAGANVVFDTTVYSTGNISYKSVTGRLLVGSSVIGPG